jgi:hypothetical protein
MKRKKKKKRGENVASGMTVTPIPWDLDPLHLLGWCLTKGFGMYCSWMHCSLFCLFLNKDFKVTEMPSSLCVFLSFLSSTDFSYIKQPLASSRCLGARRLRQIQRTACRSTLWFLSLLLTFVVLRGTIGAGKLGKPWTKHRKPFFFRFTFIFCCVQSGGRRRGVDRTGTW